MQKVCFWLLVSVTTIMMIAVLVFWEEKQMVGTKYPFYGLDQEAVRQWMGTSGKRGQGYESLSCRRPRSLMPPNPNTWQAVQEKVYYVYSAHADPRIANTTLIRIFGIMPLDRRQGPLAGETYWCQLWINAEGPPKIAQAFLYNQGHAAEQYLSAQWSCTFPIDAERLSAIGVSLAVNSSCQQPNNILAIHSVLKTANYSKRFTICIAGVLKREYSNYHQLVEWIEVNRMFGADHVVGYDYNSSGIIDPYVRYYKDAGILEMIPWTMPDIGDIDSFRVIWNLGQITAINDCIYRNMYKSEFIVSLDLDEFIIPYGKSRSWSEMMKNAGCGNKPIAIVRNVFFGIGPKWPEDRRYRDNKLVHDVLHLVTLTRTHQDKYINFFPKRSKFITRSDVVDTAGIHNVKMVWGVKDRNPFVCEVKLPFGRLHHYRDPRWKDIEPVENTFMHRYADEIINRTSQVHNKVSWLIKLY